MGQSREEATGLEEGSSNVGEGKGKGSRYSLEGDVAGLGDAVSGARMVVREGMVSTNPF